MRWKAYNWLTDTQLRHKNHPVPRAYTGVGTADFCCNFVLGRLAILRSKIETAEQYLLAASMTTGDASLDSYRPNMSLANEILKSGDPNRWTVVYTLFAKLPGVLEDRAARDRRLVGGRTQS